MKIKTFDEYLKANGWSSNKFVPHAKRIFEILSALKADIKLGRSVCHVVSPRNFKTYKIYVHHAGRSNEFITLVGPDKQEIQTWHFETTPEEVARQLVAHIVGEDK